LSPLPNAKHEIFAQEVAKGISAAEAYVSAGFKNNAGNARTLRSNQAVAKRIQAILEEREHIHAESVNLAIEKTGITMGRVLEELAKIGFANIADFVDLTGETPTWDLKDVHPDKMAAVSSLTTETVFDRTQMANGKPTEVRKVKLTFWDKRASLVDIGKHLGMFKERSDQPGSDPRNPLFARIEFAIVEPGAPNYPDGGGLSPPPDESAV
jgi:phage terminase small subunit